MALHLECWIVNQEDKGLSPPVAASKLGQFQEQCTVAPRYYAPHYYADSYITRSVVEPDFLLSGENAKWACLNLLRIALTIIKIH